jgi:hypothetical protein
MRKPWQDTVVIKSHVLPELIAGGDAAPDEREFFSVAGFIIRTSQAPFSKKRQNNAMFSQVV